MATKTDAGASLSELAHAAAEMRRVSAEATEQVHALDRLLSELDFPVELPGRPIRRDRDRNLRGHLVRTVYLMCYGRADDGHYGVLICAEADATDEQGVVRLEPEQVSWDGIIKEIVWTRRLSATHPAMHIEAIKHMPALLAELAVSARELADAWGKSAQDATAAFAEVKAALTRMVEQRRSE